MLSQADLASHRLPNEAAFPARGRSYLQHQLRPPRQHHTRGAEAGARGRASGSRGDRGVAGALTSVPTASRRLPGRGEPWASTLRLSTGVGVERAPPPYSEPLLPGVPPPWPTARPPLRVV